MAADAQTYHPSGRCQWGKLLPSIVPILATSGLLAWLLHIAFVHGWYYIIVTPLILCLPAFGLLYVGLWSSHCRSRLLSVLFAAVVGAVAYVGQYHAGLIGEVGAANAHRLDWLVDYVEFRMENDVVEDVGPGRQNARQAGRGEIFMNWFRFLLEGGMVIGIGIAIAANLAKRPYCEHCGTWTTSWSTHLPPGTGAKVQELLEADRLAGLNELRTGDWDQSVANCELKIEYCPISHDAACDTWLTVTDAATKPGKKLKKGNVSLKKLLDRVLLDEAQVDALKTACREMPVGVADPDVAASAASAPAETPAAPSPPPKPSTGEPAEFVPLPFEDRGRILSSRNIYLGTAIALAPLLLIVLGFVILGWGATMENDWSIAEGIGIVGGGIGSFALAAYIFTYFGDYLPSRFLHGVTRREIEHRTDRWVDPNDPEAIYIQIVPRENWSRIMLENASDVGFLAIDDVRREIRFEGDQERFRIPAAALGACTIESFSPPGDKAGHQLFYMNVLRAATPDGPVERLIAHRHIIARREGNKDRQRQSEQLKEQIEALAQTSSDR